MSNLNLSKNQLKELKSSVVAALKPQQGSMMAKRSKTPGRSRGSSRSNSRSRIGSRSQSRGRTRFAFQNNGKRSGHAINNFVKGHVKKMIPVVQAINQKRKAMDIMKAGYFDVKGMKDVKSVDPGDMLQMSKEIELLENELKLANTALKQGLGDRPIRMRISTSFVITTTVTSGVTNTVNINASGNASLDPSKCTEWSALAGLFDEYKCLGGECQFLYHNEVDANVAVVSDNLPVIGYDVDQNTPSSALALTQLSQHRVLAPPVYNYGGAAGATAPAGGTKHSFGWHVPRGTALYGSANTLAPGTEWVATAGVVAAGYIVFYHLGKFVTAVNTGAGFIYFDLEFRCRA